MLSPKDSEPVKGFEKETITSMHSKKEKRKVGKDKGNPQEPVTADENDQILTYPAKRLTLTPSKT